MEIGLRDTAVDAMDRMTHELVRKGWSYNDARNKSISNLTKRRYV